MIRLALILISTLLFASNAYTQKRLIHVTVSDSLRAIYLVDSSYLASIESSLATAKQLNTDLRNSLLYKESLLDTTTKQFTVLKEIATSVLDANKELTITTYALEQKAKQRKRLLRGSLAANGALILLFILL